MNATTAPRTEAARSNGNGHASEKLQESRSEFQDLFEPDDQRADSGFPRSKTMRLLLSGRGAAILAVAAGAVLIMKPHLAARAARVVPVGTLLRSLAVNLLSRK